MSVGAVQRPPVFIGGKHLRGGSFKFRHISLEGEVIFKSFSFGGGGAGSSDRRGSAEVGRSCRGEETEFSCVFGEEAWGAS